jgi:hypothetical protein
MRAVGKRYVFENSTTWASDDDYEKALRVAGRKLQAVTGPCNTLTLGCRFSSWASLFKVA